MSNKGKVVSLQVGKPQSYRFEDKEWTTGLFKSPLTDAVSLTQSGFQNDGQADLEHHGGPDKAVCVYCSGHYPYWQEVLGKELPGGAFGENVTLAGMTEKDIRIGDVFRLGEAVVQVSQPRQPCYKLGYRYGRPDMPLLVQNSGFTGWYFRVLKPGFVKQGDDLELVESSPYGMSVEVANRIMYGDRENVEGIRSLLAVPELSDSWRKTLNKRLLSK
jgi:MOSC domain-containing protein YiiM